MSSLGACTVMTIRMYVDRKGWDLEDVVVHLNHYKKDELDENGEVAMPLKKIDVFERRLEIHGNLDEKQRERILQIANKCPVHKTLHGAVEVETSIVN